MKSDLHQRKLAAILFADIAGYTSSMQMDEQNALETIHRYQLILRQVATEYEGEVIKSYGDGSMVIFQSSLNATKAALRIQESCNMSPEIPLRIGIHVGEFIIKDGDIFGNGVNLASRIESLGTPGSILVSQEVFLKVKNRPEFSFNPLGEFEFKNVEEPLTVYALANEGLVIPTRNEMSGKVKYSETKSITNRLGWLLGFALVIIGGLAASRFIERASTKNIADSSKEKSLAIANFNNQTPNQNLNSFGSMISDWITNGLKETGETNIINIANIPGNAEIQDLEGIQSLNQGKGGLIDLLLTGRYYQKEANLVVLADLVDTRTGKSSRTFKVERDKADLSGILSDLTDQIQSYWAIKENNRFLQAPPKYEAYVGWKSAQNLLLEDPEKAKDLLRNAFENDTTFYSPLFDLYGLFATLADTVNANDILQMLDERKINFTKYETLNYEYYQARRTGNLKLAAALSERMFDMDKSDYNANNRAASLYGQINQPKKAIETLEEFDDRFLGNEDRLLSWRETYKVFPNFLLRNYEEVCAIADNYKFPKISDALAVLHLKSLIRMDSLELLDKKFNYYKEEGLYSNAGNLMPLDFDLILVCDELFLTNKADKLKEYTDLLEHWCNENPESPNLERNMGYVNFYRGNNLEAIQWWQEEESDVMNLPGWLAIAQAYDRQSRIASLQAKQGQKSIAQNAEEKMNATHFKDPNLVGVPQYYSARILLSLGDLNGALTRLKHAVNEGFSFFRPAVFDTDPMLKELLHHPEFEELIRPKG